MGRRIYANAVLEGGGKQDDGNLPPKIQQVQGEKRMPYWWKHYACIPEPRANQMASGENSFGIERIDTPPTDI